MKPKTTQKKSTKASKKAVAGGSAAKKASRNTKSGQKRVQNAKELEIKQRRLKVAAWYEGGATYEQIADKLTEQGTPCSKSTVATDVQEIYAELDHKAAGYLEMRRQRQDRRYDTLIRANWVKANEGDFKAGVLVDKFMTAQNKLLGLDAATKFSHENPDGSGIMEPVAGAMTAFTSALDKIYGKPANDKHTKDK